MHRVGLKQWGFKGNDNLKAAESGITIRGVVNDIKSNLNSSDSRPVIHLGNGDPSSFCGFRTTSIAEDAVEASLRSAKFNGYAPSVGLLPARNADFLFLFYKYRAVAEYLSKDLKDKITSNDVYLTIGSSQAIEVILSVLSCPKANILLPRPGYPMYEAHSAICHLEVRHFDLIPEKDWEVDLDQVENIADENTVAIVIINPGNPCGNVFTYQHSKKIAETARKLGILVIADEVYGHLAFGSNPFEPMGNFGSIAPVITVGSISKRWIVPGWRLGWLVTNDPQGILKKHGIIDSINGFMNISSNPTTLIQGALPQILLRTNDDFFSNIIDILREAANVSYHFIKNIPSITCHNKPEGSMFIMVKIDVSMLDDILDDMEFCTKLANEESVVILPGVAVGLKNWLRISLAIDPESLIEGLGRLKEFCMRHAKKK
ncbi:tyrosine aminotransferase-like [Impatiens glandulifera]|uniref:tyrosine aminotransferase-like n=1 Tax=Impatiens glandulifera TaxID=253017 RepID=UPI001FB06C13|nr:tyrosine aminotransferase-like [Impatiens glandulifera]